MASVANATFAGAPISSFFASFMEEVRPTQKQPIRPEQYTNIAAMTSGSYGQIFTATDMVSNKEVVIKKIPKSVDHRRVSNEIIANQRMVSQKGVTHFHGHFETKNHQCLVFDRVKGGDLFNLMEYNNFAPLPEDVVRTIMRQVAQTLLQCHSHAIAHKDVKLENILVDFHLTQASLIDFGLCSFTEGMGPNERYSSDFCGSLEYLAPEVVKQIPFVATKSDVWSFAVTLFSLLFGQFPFYVADSIAKRVDPFPVPAGRGSPALPENNSRSNINVSSEARHLLDLMLRVDPAQRISMDAVLTHPWFNKTVTKKSLSSQ